MAHTPVGVDQLFTILSHPYRRRALAVLAAADSTLTIRDVAHDIVDREYDAELHAVPSEAVIAVYLSLVHAHLPMLEDADLIRYDSSRLVIEEVDLSEIRPLLSDPPREKPSLLLD